jgi:hypothetical protein
MGFMNQASATVLSSASMDDDAWDDLLSFIEERRVIPIVGPELLQVATDTGPRLLLDWVAEKLAAQLQAIRPNGDLRDTQELRGWIRAAQRHP